MFDFSSPKSSKSPSQGKIAIHFCFFLSEIQIFKEKQMVKTADDPD